MARVPNARKIRKLRSDAGLTIRAIQEETGISESTLRGLEKGRAQNPSLETLDVLADFYRLATVDELLIKGTRTGEDEAE